MTEVRGSYAFGNYVQPAPWRISGRRIATCSSGMRRQRASRDQKERRLRKHAGPMLSGTACNRRLGDLRTERARLAGAAGDGKAQCETEGARAAEVSGSYAFGNCLQPAPRRLAGSKLGSGATDGHFGPGGQNGRRAYCSTRATWPSTCSQFDRAWPTCTGAARYWPTNQGTRQRSRLQQPQRRWRRQCAGHECPCFPLPHGNPRRRASD